MTDHKPEKPEKPWLPLLLTGLVLPGMGQLYRKEKAKGYVLAGLSLVIVLGGFARYMSVLFALANVKGRDPHSSFQPIRLLIEAWNLDRSRLLAFLGGFLAIWLLSVADILLTKEKKS